MRGNPIAPAVTAVRVVLSAGRRYTIGAVILTLVLYLAYLLLPVWLTPGNDLAFQLTILRFSDHLLFLALSAVTAALIVMQAYLFIRTRGAERASAVGRGGVGTASALFAGLLASAACFSCIATLLGFLGSGSALFIVEQRRYFVLGALALVLVALYLTARGINGYCERCGILPRRAGAGS